jgi:molybdopterin/thiamine biosynthesis adenylyltransferase
VISALARFGIGSLILVDGDTFVDSNLNRQLFSNSDTLGKNKALSAKEALAKINPDVEVTAIPENLNMENASEILKNSDVVVDCLDNIPSRLVLQNACKALEIPLIHGAIDGFFGQVSVVFPDDNTLDELYTEVATDAEPHESQGNPGFTPMLIGAIQAAEAIKLLTGMTKQCERKLIIADLLNMEFDNVNI